MSTPLITVGIPFYNNEETLLDAIRSIFAQTFQNWELILVDDGSTDGSLDIALSIDDSRVRVLPPDGKNKRLPARLNQISQAARGEFIARMDADDLSHPERLAKQLAFLDTHKEVDVVGTSMYILDRQMQPTCKIIAPERYEVIVQNRFKGVGMAHATVMARAKWFRQYRYNENNIRSEDFELWMSSISESMFSNISKLLYFCLGPFTYSISTYAMGKHSGAKAIWRYASSEIGKLRSAYYAGRYYAHIVVYTGCNFLGLREWLVRRRYQALTPEEYAEANDVIAVIRKTEVPIRRIK